MRLVLFFLLIILFSCTSEDISIEKHLDSILKSKYIEYYNGYNLMPVQRRVGIIDVQLPDNKLYSVLNFESNKQQKLIIATSWSGKEIVKDSLIVSDIQIFLDNSMKLGVISYIDNNKYQVIYTNIIDVNKTDSVGKLNKYILIKTDSLYNEIIVNLYLKEEPKKIRKDWYIYSSDLYKDYDNIEDFILNPILQKIRQPN